MEDIAIRRRKLRRYFSVGAIILVLGLAFWSIPSVIIGGLNNRINQLSSKGGLSEPEQNLLTNLYWSRSWWEMTQITISNPLTIMIMVIGLLLIAYGFTIRFV